MPAVKSLHRLYLPCWGAVAACLWRSLLLFCVCSVANSTAWAAPQARWANMGDQVFQYFGAEKGLPHPVVTALAEDADGMLWVGTQGGLARWDGYRFRNYQPDARQEGSLPDNFIQALHVDASGVLWIGTSGGGLARYVREFDRFQSYGVGENGVSHVAVHAITDDGNGGLWIGTNRGLDHYDSRTQKFSHFLQGTDAGKADAMPDNQVHALLRLGKNHLLIGTSKGLMRARVNLQQSPPLIQISKLNLPSLGTQPIAVQSFLLAKDGAIWIGTTRHGVFLLHKGQIEPLHQSLPEAIGLSNDFILNMAQMQDGSVWLGTYGQGLIRIDILSRNVKRIRHDPLLISSLADDTVWSILPSKAGFLWLGNQRGLQLHDANQNAVLTMFGIQNRKNGLSEPDVFSVLPLDDGSIWLGLGTNGIDIIDPRDASVRGLRPNPNSGKHGLPGHRILAMVASGQYVYVGTGLGLYRVEQASLDVQAVAADASLNDIRTLLVQGNRLWLAGFQSGLWSRPLNGPIEQPAQRPLGVANLSDQRISMISPGPNDKLWIGTRNGLNLYDPASGEVERIMPNPADEHGLSAGLILSMMTDQLGRLWVGTLGGGICILEGRDSHGRPRFRQIGIEHGLPHLNVAQILQDKEGMVWVSTDSGLARIDPRNFTVHTLQAAEGVPVVAYWGNSGAKTNAGELLFGGTGGLSIVRPKLFQEWRYQAPTVVTEVRVMGKALPPLKFNRGYDKVAGLILEPGKHHLSIEFAALDYSAPERLRYMYRLEGYDKAWIETEATRRLATYTNLPPGKFMLHLRGSNRLGKYAEQDLVVPITILPAWYQTWWFNLAQILLALAAVSLLLRFSTHYLRQRQRELESQVLQRTAQLQDKQDQLLAAISGLNQANQDLALSADTLRQLGDVGRDITANLDAERVFEALHQHVGNLLDASTLVIYRSDARGKYLTRCFGREDGLALPSIDIPLDSPTSHTALAVRERREVLLERNRAQAQARIGGRRLMLTSLFAPLIIDTHVLGVMAIQSETEHAYGERERMIFRTLCGYGAIALANAEVLAALHEAQHQLVQQEKLAALGGLVTGVAHEINTPLGVTILALSGIKQAWQEILQDGSARTASVAHAVADGLSYTDMALHNANRAAALITSFQAITAHFESDFPDELDLTQYLPEVAALLQAEFANRGQVLSIEVQPGLHVQTVAAALTEALGRVLANVHDHAFAPNQLGQVRLKAQQIDDDWIEISVHDDGVGIAEEALPKVFDPFFTTAGGNRGHVGLGLHVAYNHVTQRLKGRILIDSDIARGTTVVIRLPRYFPLEK